MHVAVLALALALTGVPAAGHTASTPTTHIPGTHVWCVSHYSRNIHQRYQHCTIGMPWRTRPTPVGHSWQHPVS